MRYRVHKHGGDRQPDNIIPPARAKTWQLCIIRLISTHNNLTIEPVDWRVKLPCSGWKKEDNTVSVTALAAALCLSPLSVPASNVGLMQSILSLPLFLSLGGWLMKLGALLLWQLMKELQLCHSRLTHLNPHGILGIHSLVSVADKSASGDPAQHAAAAAERMHLFPCDTLVEEDYRPGRWWHWNLINLNLSRPYWAVQFPQKKMKLLSWIWKLTLKEESENHRVTFNFLLQFQIYFFL